MSYLGAEGSVVSGNLFAYCLNNPVSRCDANGNWSLPNWAKMAIGSVATAGAGTAVAVIAIGAAKGAAIGMVSGAAIGAGTSAIRHRVQSGSWKGAGEAALNGRGEGALSGAITGAITGAVSSAVKVANAAKAWDASSKGGPFKNMSDHYYRHVIKEGKKAMTKDIITYTNDAKALWDSCNGVGKLVQSGSLKLVGDGVKGFFAPSGLIRSFFYQ